MWVVPISINSDMCPKIEVEIFANVALIKPNAAKMQFQIIYVSIM